MKQFTIIFVFTLYFLNGFSQKEKCIYADTIFQFDQMRIAAKGISYKTFGKVYLNVTNLTDSFKIIYPKDVSISDIYGKQFTVNSKTMFVIPPKTTRRYMFVVENSEFKAESLNVIISAVHTTGKIESIYQFSPFILNQSTFDLIDKSKQFPIVNVGNLSLTLKNFEYFARGNMAGQIVVKYNGNKFLGVFATNITLTTMEGKSFVNHKQTASSLYYNPNKKEMKLNFNFENPYGSSIILKEDKLLTENVFVEYNTYSNNAPLQFKLRKKSENELKNEEEKKEDIEVIEE